MPGTFEVLCDGGLESAVFDFGTSGSKLTVLPNGVLATGSVAYDALEFLDDGVELHLDLSGPVVELPQFREWAKGAMNIEGILSKSGLTVEVVRASSARSNGITPQAIVAGKVEQTSSSGSTTQHIVNGPGLITYKIENAGLDNRFLSSGIWLGTATPNGIQNATLLDLHEEHSTCADDLLNGLLKHDRRR